MKAPDKFAKHALLVGILCASLAPTLIVCVGELVPRSALSASIRIGYFLLFVITGFQLIGFLVVGLGSVPFLFSLGTRARALLICKTCLLLFVSMLCAMWSSSLIRSAGIDLYAERAKPLIGAIEKYQKKYGHPPNYLKELVPEFISKVPGPDIGFYPKYEYERLDDDKDPWELSVDCSSVMQNRDEFYYLPSKKYEAREDGVVEKRGDWAYLSYDSGDSSSIWFDLLFD